jgi:hypothetical protein
MTTVTNYINYSQQIDQWPGLNTTVDTGISDPNGGTDAQRINFNASGSYRIINSDTPINIGETATGSIWVRNPTSTSANIGVARKVGIGSFERTLKAVPLTSEWTRIEVTHTYANNQSGSRFDITANSGSIEVFGAQLEYNVPQASNYYVLTTTDAPRTVDLATLTSGWGAKTWGEETWGDLSNATASPSGISATTSIGSSTTQANANVDVTGSQLTFTNAGAVGGTSVQFSVTGIQATLSIGEEDISRGIQQDVTGSQLTSTTGSVTIDDQFLIGSGWGRDAWGSMAWGDAYSVQLVGISMTASMGEEAAGTDVVVAVSGNQLDITYANPSFSIQIDQDIFVIASEDQLDGSLGSLTLTGTATVDVTGIELSGSVGQAVGGTKTPVDVTGIQATMTLGDFTLVQSTNEPVTGQQLTLALGEAVEIPAQIVGVSGIQLTSSIGSVTVVGTSVVQPTGISASFSVGQVNVTPWQEINLGVNNVWTEVDLAA